MSTATTATPWTNNSDANFRAWGSWISAQFDAFGWVLVGSVFATGTDWTDVTAPAASNTARVTELWRMDDAAQATAPLFILVDYGENGVDIPAMRIRFGTGGSAPTTLSGQFFDTGTSYFAPNTANTNSMTHYASGDAGRIAFTMAASGTGWTNSNVLGFGIERRINNAGAPQATGWLFYRYVGPSTRSTIAWKGDGTGALSVFLSSMPFPASYSFEANLTFDGKQGIHPLVYAGLGPAEAGLNMVCHPASAYSVGNTYSVTLFGSSHTYLAMGAIGALTVLAGSAVSVSPAMRWE